VDSIPLFDKVANCTTVQQMGNCGTAEIAYFTHIVQRYDGDLLSQLAPLTAFIQGEALEENPHIIHDIRNYVPGTTYSDLTRRVRNAWQFARVRAFEVELQNRTNPVVWQKGSWLAGWRSMLMASRSAILNIEKSTYNDYI